jgi:hypothetical protein
MESVPCAVADDCAAACPAGTVPMCIDGECACPEDLAAPVIGQYSELALAADGTAYVSAYDSTYGDLVVARWEGAGRIEDDAWEYVDGVPDGPVVLEGSLVRGGIEAEGDDVGLYTDIAISRGDVAMVSYFDRTTASLKLATRSGDAWRTHVVDAGRPPGGAEPGHVIVGQYSSIVARADDGRPGIAYFAQLSDGGDTVQTELRFALATTAEPASADDWTTHVVDGATAPAPAETDPFLIPDGIGLFAAAAIAPDDTPVLAYYDRIAGDLRLARFDAAAGGFAPPQVLDGASDDAGWHPSLRVAADGVAHVSYVCATADDLLYLNTRTMTRQLVDDGYRVDGTTDEGDPVPVFHFVGDDSAIALTTTGPVIAYQDATTHELLLARKDATGAWGSAALAGNEEPFAGGYGFYASAEATDDELVISTWVIDQPTSDTWVEIFRQPIVD